MIGGNVTDYDYQIIDKDGEVHNYIWDDEESKMVEGKRERNIPWWQIHKIAEDLNGTSAFKTCLLYTSPSPRDAHESRMPSSA